MKTKTLLSCACCLVASSVFADPILDKIDALDCDEDQKSKLVRAYEDYQRSVANWLDVAQKMGLKKSRPKAKPISADLVDPTIRKIQEEARKYHARYEVLKRTQNKWGPSTNLLARAARQSMQSRLDETRTERDQAKAEAKALKDMQKAARKFGKNIEKVRKDFEKYRDKASTDDERAFWQSLLDILPVPND